MAKDFFDEEYEKQTGQGLDNGDNLGNGGNDSWFNRPAPNQEQTKSKKPLYIVIVCVALVLCIVFGWVLCTIFQGISFNYNTDGSGASNYGGDILDTVIKYLKENYYKDIDDETWLDAIEYSGTALMQKAGDRYSQLMSPQTYYDFYYSTSESVASDEIFGVSFVVEEGVGLYVSSVIANSAAYGKLKEGDIILKLTDMVGSSGNAPVITSGTESITFEQMVVGQWSSEAIQKVLAATKSANFIVLRFGSEYDDGYTLLTVNLTRQKIRPVVSNYQYGFIEFYFSDEYSNVSLPSPDGLSTYEERHLDQLPADTGYVRIVQFMDYTKTDANGNIVLDGKGNPVKVSASEEFAEVMALFKTLKLKHLVLDLKGNPGGNVSYVSEIGGMLVTTVGDKLTDAQKKSVTNSKNELLMTYLDMPKPAHVVEYHYQESSYFQYFNAMGSTCDIVVWTDGGSASGSEMLTGILREYGTAVHMGTKTYGKGIAQTYQELPFTQTLVVNGEKIVMPWAIYYTCAKYYSPLGVNIHGEGYTPDAPYNGLSDYESLWNAAKIYWALN